MTLTKKSLVSDLGVKLLTFLRCLQDEMEELRSEMLEMRDMYMEDDVYQLQELRQQLEQVGLLADGPIQ